MANRQVNLTKRVQTLDGWRYCAVLLSANGRVKPDVVLVNGHEERHPEGAYYLEWRESSKRVRLSVGKEAQDAVARRLRKEAELNAINNGVAVLPENGNGQRSVAATVADYLDEVKLTKKPKTLAAYSTALGYFTESCRKMNLEEIERGDLLKFSAFLRDEKSQSPRSVYNKFENVMTFLKLHGIRGLVDKNDWPRFVEEEPEVYEREELDKLFKASHVETGIRTSNLASSMSGQSGIRTSSWQLLKELRSSQSSPAETDMPASAAERANTALTVEGEARRHDL